MATRCSSVLPSCRTIFFTKILNNGGLWRFTGNSLSSGICFDTSQRLEDLIQPPKPPSPSRKPPTNDNGRGKSALIYCTGLLHHPDYMEKDKKKLFNGPDKITLIEKCSPQRDNKFREGASLHLYRMNYPQVRASLPPRITLPPQTFSDVHIE